ncbi:TIGR00645 family protein [Sessilibacter sp. MAH2]
MKAVELFIEAIIFRSRWLLAPFFLGLILATIALLVKFMKELYVLASQLLSLTSADVIISILTLVDTTLIASLLFIIILSGYESFVSKIDFYDHEDRPSWMGKVGFSELKLKLIGAIVAISAIELLKAFVDGSATNQEIAWKIAIHMTFVVSGVLFAITDYISARKNKDDKH